jgi:hypothetical protein
MKFYKTLPLHIRINLKGEVCGLLCGIDFDILGKLFTFEERMNIIEDKLQLEGLI